MPIYKVKWNETNSTTNTPSYTRKGVKVAGISQNKQRIDKKKKNEISRTKLKQRHEAEASSTFVSLNISGEAPPLSSSFSSYSSSSTTITAPLNIRGRRPSTYIRRQSHRRISSQLYDALQEVMQQSRFKRQGSSQHFIPANTSKNICCDQGIWKGQWRSFLVLFRCLANFQMNSKNLALIRRPLCFLKSNINPIFAPLASSDLALAMTRRNVFSPVPSPWDSPSS